jgi:sterol desaturase/sphingolipid hydroxylase (fatty acid hydroxylase superfamily)
LAHNASDGSMTATVYFGEMLVASLVAITLLEISSFRTNSEVVLFGARVFAWSLAEYIVHRFMLHGFSATEHRRHHANPSAPVLTIFWQTWACFVLVYLIAGDAVLAGTLAAYAWYLFVHYHVHHDPDSLPSSLLKHHKRHHRIASRNYGVSTTLWDHVFGTMLH